MEEKIKSVLNIIEKEHNVQILYACESGSRAWGFDSIDSDWDIRFIYRRPLESYLTIYPEGALTLDQNSSNVIKTFTKYDLDFAGWDVKKALYQLSKGNPDLVSWFVSPIQYKITNEGLLLTGQAYQFFKPVSAFYHYTHMAEGNYNQYIKNVEGPLVRRKKYLYVLRPLLNCAWIDLFGTPPPMLFDKVYENTYIKPKLIKYGVYKDLTELIELKRSGAELDNMERIPSIDKFCEWLLAYFKDKSKKAAKMPINVDYSGLDTTFKQIILSGGQNG